MCVLAQHEADILSVPPAPELFPHLKKKQTYHRFRDNSLNFGICMRKYDPQLCSLKSGSALRSFKNPIFHYTLLFSIAVGSWQAAIFSEVTVGHAAWNFKSLPMS
jgi:hypothetical protein